MDSLPWVANPPLSYIIDADGNIVPCRNPEELGEFLSFDNFEKNRRIAKDMVGEVCISTVFLAIDHSFGLGGPPLLWETMVFGGESDMFCRRYSSRQDAEEGHQAVVYAVENGIKLTWD